MIYLVRHGQTEFNVEGRYQGRRDSPLTARGLQHARRYGEQLRRLGAPEGWRIVSSPLGRARRTAEIIAETLDFEGRVELEPRLAEIGFGSWEGMTREEIHARHPHTRAERLLFLACPDGEGYEAVEARVAAWLSEFDWSDPRRTVVIAHGGSGRILRAVYMRRGVTAVAEMDTPHDAIFRLAGGQVERIECEPVG